MFQRLVAALTPKRAGRRQTVRLLWSEPPHPDREADPAYRHFTRRRRRLAADGELVCDRCGSTTKVELHHRIPYALQGGVDIAALTKRYGIRNLTEETFGEWYHGPENTVPLCDPCHTLCHAVPAPAWRAIEVWNPRLPLPVKVDIAR